ncbi:1577_t:CDS:2, partial [Gigaspora rosea]
ALSERWKDQKNDVYIITKPNIHSDIFKLILENDIMNTSAKDSLNILVASDELELLDLAESVQKYLIKKFSPCKTANSFIFSFTDQSNPMLSRVKIERKNEAIWNDESYGACFGNSDLCMKSNKIWTSKWVDYECRITNSCQLIVEEYEVLAVNS